MCSCVFVFYSASSNAPQARMRRMARISPSMCNAVFMLGGFLARPLNAKCPAHGVKDWQVCAKAKLDCHRPGAFKCCRVAQWHPARKDDYAAVLAKCEMRVRIYHGGSPVPVCCLCSHNVCNVVQCVTTCKKKMRRHANYFSPPISGRSWPRIPPRLPTPENVPA